MGTIVLGYDGSDGAEAALRVTSELALATGDCRGRGFRIRAVRSRW